MPAETRTCTEPAQLFNKLEQIIDSVQDKYGLEWQALTHDNTYFGEISFNVVLVPPQHENFADDTAFLWVVAVGERYSCAHGTKAEAKNQNTTMSALEMISWLRENMHAYLPEELAKEVFVAL